MKLNLFESDFCTYSAKSAMIEIEKQLAIYRGDAKAAKVARQKQSALYKEFELKQLPPEPPSEWEVEMNMTLEERVDRIERHLKLGRYKKA